MNLRKALVSIYQKMTFRWTQFLTVRKKIAIPRKTSAKSSREFNCLYWETFIVADSFVFFL